MIIVDMYRKAKPYIPKPLISIVLGISEKFGLVDLIVSNNIRNFYANTKLFSKGDLVFDIGANKGEYSELFLGMGARVVAAEPQPEHAQELKKKLEGREFVMVQKGVSEKAGQELELYMCKDDGASTFSKEFIDVSNQVHQRVFEGTVKATTTTLDEMISQHGVPKYCKIDVEGYEKNVLAGLNTPIEMISFEIHANAMKDVQECLKTLSKIGDYEYNYTDYLSEKLALNAWVGEDSIIAAIEKEKQTRPAWGGDIYARLVK